MVSIVDMLKRSEKFSLAFDRSMPIRFQQQFWQLITFLDKPDQVIAGTSHDHLQAHHLTK